MRPIPDPLAAAAIARGPSALGIAGRVVLHAISLLIGVVAFVLYKHFALQGASTASLVSLVAAAGFGLSPLRGLLHGIFALERKVLHVAHGLGGLLLVGLTLGGGISGGPVLTHAALAPFAMMGAAQAIMHQEHPRNAEQAAALRQFATSLPEVEEFTRSGDLTSPANAQRAIVVLTDLVTKAQTLGETELRADPQFQSAWQQATTRVGLSLGLDAIDNAVSVLAANPATAGAVPELRRRLVAARQVIGPGRGDEDGARHHAAARSLRRRPH
jgi:hypothetical protein